MLGFDSTVSEQVEDLHLVLPALNLNLSTLNAGILILIQLEESRLQGVLTTPIPVV